MATDNFARFMALQALDNSNSSNSDTSDNAGKIVTGKEYTIDGTQYTAQTGAEVFNDYENNKAVGDYSHAEGYYTRANGKYSHAEGYYTIATGDASHAMGKYNVEDTKNKYAFIIGNGTSYTSRSNAFAIDWNGNIYVGNSETAVNVLDLLNRIISLEARVATLEGGV